MCGQMLATVQPLGIPIILPSGFRGSGELSLLWGIGSLNAFNYDDSGFSGKFDFLVAWDDLPLNYRYFD